MEDGGDGRLYNALRLRATLCAWFLRKKYFCISLKDSPAARRILPMNTLRRLVATVFGNISWQPPGWMFSAGQSVRRHRRIAAIALLVAALGGAGAWRGHAWLEKRQRQARVAQRVQAAKAEKAGAVGAANGTIGTNGANGANGAVAPKSVIPAGPQSISIHANAIPVTNLEKDLHPAQLCIWFGGGVAPVNSAGGPVTSGIHMDPPVEGTWNWQGDQQLLFTPKNDWAASQKYHITFDKSAFSPNVVLDHYSVDATTPPFTASVTRLEFSQDPKNPGLKQIVATVEFSHSIATGDAGKYVTLAMEGGSPVFDSNGAPFSVTYGLHNRVAYITTSPLTLPEKDDVMKLTVDRRLQTTQGGAPLQSGAERRIDIPDVYSFFKIESTETQIARDKTGGPEQIVFVKTTSDAKSEDLAKSLEIFLLPKKAEPAAKQDDKTADRKSDDASDSGDSNDVEAAAANEYKADADYDRPRRGDDGDDARDSDSADDQSDSNSEAGTEAAQRTAAPTKWMTTC